MKLIYGVSGDWRRSMDEDFCMGVPEDAAPTSLCLCRSPTILRRPEAEFNSMSPKDKKRKGKVKNVKHVIRTEKMIPLFGPKKWKARSHRTSCFCKSPPVRQGGVERATWNPWNIELLGGLQIPCHGQSQ